MSENRVLTADDEQIAAVLHALRKSAKAASRLTENYRPPMNGERYLTDKEVSNAESQPPHLAGIPHRTHAPLHHFWWQGLIPRIRPSTTIGRELS